MEVIPSIDLRGGRCVRLYQGDYTKETVFSEDPVGVAKQWESLGAPRLHIVDLDGAATGRPCHLSIVGRIASGLRIPVQLGGGIRDLEVIEHVLKIGIERVILGTAAVENPDLVKEACLRFGEAIVIGLDARDGFVAVRGWRRGTMIPAVDLLQQMEALGVRRFIYTDITRDGTLTHPNFQAIAGLMKEAKSPIIASGGVASIGHLKKLKQMGLEGAIVGRALYTGDIQLDKAIDALSRDPDHPADQTTKDGA